MQPAEGQTEAFLLALGEKADIMLDEAVETDLAERQPSGNLFATISSWLPLIVWFSAAMIPQSAGLRM
jgi:hypothetical protein